MKPTKILLPALLLGMATGAYAQMFHVPAPALESTVMKSRSAGVKALASAPGQKLDPKVTLYTGSEAADVEKLGTLRLVMEEDFSKMSSGSIDEPDTETSLIRPVEDIKYPWWNLNPEFTHLPNWGGGAEGSALAGQAGGCYYMKSVFEPYVDMAQAHINTPLLDVSHDGAVAVFEFKARTRAEGDIYDGLLVEFAETNNMGPTWNMPEDAVQINGVGAEWTTYRVLFRGCGPTSLFHLVATGNGEIYIDDIKVYQLVPHVGMPELKAHSEYKGTSFVANWGAVEGAEKYLLSLYYQESTPAENPMMRPTVEDVYVFADKEVPDNKYTVTGVESGQTYFYTVKAVKGDKVSVESFPMRVYDLEVPVMKPADILDGCTYTASWGEVPCANAYNYFAYNIRKAEADGPFVVTDEDFTGVALSDGTLTGFTKEAPEDKSLDEYYSNQLNQQGWRATNGCPYTDYICLDAYHYIYSNSQSGFISPEFDLSKDGGKIKIEVDLAGRECIAYTSETEYEMRVTQACMALFNWNDARGDYDQVELVSPDGDKKVTEDWQHFTFTLTKGSARSVVGLFAIYAPDNLYVDNFKMIQNYKAGDTLMEPFRFKQYQGGFEGENPTSIDVVVPERVQGCDIWHQVAAHGRQADAYGQSYDDRQSAYSPLEFVMTSKSGVDDVTVDAAGNAPAEYFRIDGVRVAAEKLVPGVYVVRQGNEVKKVVVK